MYDCTRPDIKEVIGTLTGRQFLEDGSHYDEKSKRPGATSRTRSSARSSNLRDGSLSTSSQGIEYNAALLRHEDLISTTPIKRRDVVCHKLTDKTEIKSGTQTVYICTGITGVQPTPEARRRLVGVSITIWMLLELWNSRIVTPACSPE